MRATSDLILRTLLASTLVWTAGCGPKTQGESPSGPSGPPDPAATEAAPPGPVEPTAASVTDGMALVPAGEFIMGAPERPRRVTLSAFHIDRTEVSNSQYGKFLEAVKDDDDAYRHAQQPATKTHHVPRLWDDPTLGKSHASLPVVGVDWFDAYAYAKWAGKRLPTEAEWECAARGSDGRLYPWGNTAPEGRGVTHANFFGYAFPADGRRHTAPVDSYPNGASPAGCLNMAGNVMEWTADWYGATPKARRAQNPQGPATGTARVTKGGAWNLSAAGLRSYRRWPMAPSQTFSSVGFRCARDTTAARQ